MTSYLHTEFSFPNNLKNYKQLWSLSVSFLLRLILNGLPFGDLITLLFFPLIKNISVLGLNILDKL